MKKPSKILFTSTILLLMMLFIQRGYAYEVTKGGVATLVSEAAIDKFRIDVAQVQIAGKPFALEIIVYDRQGEILTDYSGTLNLEVSPVSSEENTSKIQPAYVSSFLDGVAKIFAIYPEAGRVKIVVKDLNQKTGESREIFFLPAKFQVEPQPPFIAGKEFTLKITALNYADKVTRNYKGPAVIKPFNTEASFQGNILFEKGIAQAKITYHQWGERKFIVCDKTYPDICGITQNLFFRPYRFTVDIDSPPKDRKNFYFEELFKGKVRVFDYQDNLIPEYGGVAVLESVPDVDMPQKLYFGWHTSGEDVFYLSGVTDKPFKVKVYDAIFPEAKGESDLVSLMPARIKVELIEVKRNKAKLKIKIEDHQGNVVKEDNSTNFVVHLVESNPDESAYLVGLKKIKAKNGGAIIIVANKEKETVTVVPESEPYLEATPLEIAFK